MLAAKVTAALATLSSVHLEIDAGAIGNTLGVPTAADVKLAGGQAVGEIVTISDNGTAFTITTVDGKSYAKLPDPLNGTGKAYVLVSPTSSNATARATAAKLPVASATSAVGELGAIVKSARELSRVGTDTVNGQALAHYTMTIDPAAADSPPLVRQLAGLTKDAIPVSLWLDSSSRPERLTLAPKISSMPLTLTITISNFNAPLTISAPPPDQVFTG
jgi:hypothetical protein